MDPFLTRFSGLKCRIACTPLSLFLKLSRLEVGRLILKWRDFLRYWANVSEFNPFFLWNILILLASITSLLVTESSQSHLMSSWRDVMRSHGTWMSSRWKSQHHLRFILMYFKPVKVNGYIFALFKSKFFLLAFVGNILTVWLRKY